MKKILCFGDSNTYGYRPEDGGRYDETIRWTGRLQKKLGEGYEVIEEGLCGRTSIFEDDRVKGRKGIDSVEKIVKEQNPIDVFVVMLGTNDCKTKYHASAKEIADGLEQLILKAKSKAPKETKVLVISPILLGKGVGEEGYDVEFNEDSEKVSLKLGEEYKKVAERNGYDFLNAADYAKPSATDREHLNVQGHEKLAEAIYQKIIEIQGIF